MSDSGNDEARQMDWGRILKVEPMQPTDALNAGCGIIFSLSSWVDGSCYILIERAEGKISLLLFCFVFFFYGGVKSRSHFARTACWDYSGNIKLLFHPKHLLSRRF